MYAYLLGECDDPTRGAFVSGFFCIRDNMGMCGCSCSIIL